jgi:hypothetical protein
MENGIPIRSRSSSLNHGNQRDSVFCRYLIVAFMTLSSSIPYDPLRCRGKGDIENEKLAAGLWSHCLSFCSFFVNDELFSREKRRKRVDKSQSK